MRTIKISVLLVAILAVGYVALFIREYFRLRSGPPAPIQTSLVLNYTGSLDPTLKPLNIRIYKIEKWSTASDFQDVFNSKVEIEAGAGYIAFTWPKNNPFYATSADVLDLDRDGSKELVLESEGSAVRVISYENGELKYRDGADDLTSLSYNVGPCVANKQLVFVRGIAFPSHDAENYVQVPRLVRWTKKDGFQDVTHDFKQYYTQTVMPDLKKTMNAQTNQRRRLLYRVAIEVIEKELSARD